jgi:hypothetical protein
VVEQPADSDKIVVDNVTDVAATFEEVCAHTSHRISNLCKNYMVRYIKYIELPVF